MGILVSAYIRQAAPLAQYQNFNAEISNADNTI